MYCVDGDSLKYATGSMGGLGGAAVTALASCAVAMEADLDDWFVMRMGAGGKVLSMFCAVVMPGSSCICGK